MTDIAIRQPAQTGTVQCGAKQSVCVCILEPHPPHTPHECDPHECGGSWRYTADGEFEVISYPTKGGADGLAAILGLA